ncbi:MAG TPA: hypothetical protein VFO80_11615 [Sphingomonas sp.]|nr:hypothetical protein [Sphingomonas sp.]
MTRCPFCCHDRGPLFNIARGSWFRIDVFRHSLEVTGQLGTMRFASELGTLNIEPGMDLPLTMRAACKGKFVDEILDHHLLRDRNWKIIDIADSLSKSDGVVVITGTNFVPYRMPWA